MEYEQLDIMNDLDPEDLVSLNVVSDSDFVALGDDVLDGNSFIHPKIDYYSAIFENCSIHEVISWVGLGTKGFKDEFFKAQSERSSGYDDVFVFSYNGVQVDVSKFYLYGKPIELSAFDLPLPKIRLNISGKGLDYLRSTGFEVDELFRDPTYLLEGQHITRVDFAFDFVNYKQDILDQFIEYVETNQTDSGRIVLMNKASSLRGSIRKVDQKTVYIGSTTSDQLLRVYDKRLQNIDRQTGLYTGEDPYSSPDSWIRFELQLRNKRAHNMCLQPIDFAGVFHYLHDYYKFADLSTPAHRREPAAFWVEFMNWETLPPIIQNLQIVQKVQTQAEKIDNSFSYWVCNFVLWISRYGADGLCAYVNDWISKMQDFEHSECPPIYNKRWRSFLNKVNSCDLNLEKGIERDGLCISESNKLYFNLSSRSFYEVQQIAERYKEGKDL